MAPNNLYAYVFALKLPVIIGELALAGIVYYVLRQEEGERTATKGSARSRSAKLCASIDYDSADLLLACVDMEPCD